MSRRRSNVADHGLPDPIFVRYPGIDDAASSINYIVCLNGRVLERYKVWSLNTQGVREVHPIDRVKLFDVFAEDTFRSTFFNSRRCRIQFIGRRSLNGSVKVIRFADVISDSTLNIISTRNIFVHTWGKYPTLIGPNCSDYTCQAYVPITCQKGFNQRCDHERLRLEWLKRKIVPFKRHLVRVRQNIRDEIIANYVFPYLNDALGMGYPANSQRSSLPNEIEFCDDWVHVGGSTF